MIGSHAVSVIVDAYMKGHRDFDIRKGTGGHDSLSTIRYGKRYQLYFGCCTMGT
jgi:hypothetical protein